MAPSVVGYIVAFLCCIGLSSGRITNAFGGSSVWTDCTDPASPMKITNIQISPNPITLPGYAWFTLQGYSNQSIGSSRMILDIQSLGSWFDLTLPCLFNIGSCTYPDLCTMLDDMIAEDWAGIANDLGTQIRDMIIANGMDPSACPQPAQQISLDRIRMSLPRLPRILSFFATGTYHANIRIVNNANDQEIQCINLDMDMQREQCDGWFCSFGF